MNNQTDDKTNKDRPLFGLEDIIPIEPIVEQLTSPKPYSGKIEVSSSQQSNIELLKKLIGHDEEHYIPTKARVKRPIKILRIAIGFALIIAITLPILFNSPSFPPPHADNRVSNFKQYITSLPNGATVLVAFEFQPGFSGELDSSTQAILTELMSKNAFLVFVSTSPNGVIQAERAIMKAKEESGIIYESPLNYINLGFIPGKASGLQNLAKNPRLTTPSGIEFNNIWQLPQLRNLNLISDFNLVIVISDSSNTVRDWIEQVRPNLLSTPLLMVVSALVEPMVIPYYEALPRQVDGILVGLAGSASYENFAGQISIANQIWPSFSMAVIVATLILILGGIISAIIAASEDEFPRTGAE